MIRYRLVARALLCASFIATRAHAQGISARDTKESARFAAVTRAATQAGYLKPLIVGHGAGSSDSLFVLLATFGDSGVLIATAEAPSGASVVLEREKTPAQLGVRTVRIDAFVGAKDLFDIVVQHAPHMLEISREFDLHHVVRRGDTGFSKACEIDGNMTSSVAKGPTSTASIRRVAISRATDVPPALSFIAFDVAVSEETRDRTRADTAGKVTSHSDSRARYVMPANGPCTKTQ